MKQGVRRKHLVSVAQLTLFGPSCVLEVVFAATLVSSGSGGVKVNMPGALAHNCLLVCWVYLVTSCSPPSYAVIESAALLWPQVSGQHRPPGGPKLLNCGQSQGAEILCPFQDGWEKIKNEGIKASGHRFKAGKKSLLLHGASPLGWVQVLEEFLDTGHIRSTAGPSEA